MFGGKFRVSKRTARTVLAWGFVVVGVLMVSLITPHVAFAVDGEEFNAGNGVVSLIGSILATFIDTIANTLGSITLVVIKSTVINILNYNNFTGSSIVNLGWTLVRDMVNMFAVIVLLIMAVKTIISNSSSAWQQQIPRFFLGIVFANFSRTLVGLAIDASQIVMMTFVNAIMGIAAGNFAQLLVMPQATSFSLPTFQGAQVEATQLLTVAANIANAYAKLLVQVIVLVVMILLAVGFIWRIVSLWFVLIMAPMAGFSWGAMEIVKFLATFYNQWVAKAVPPLLWGPLTAFFLYLALAVSSNGNLAKAEAFPEPDSEVIPGQVKLEVFESTNFTGLLIAVVFLILGIQESAKISSKMGGLAARAINDKTFGRALRIGRTVSGAVVGAPLLAAKAGITSARVAAQLAGNEKLTTGLQMLESPLEHTKLGAKKVAKTAGERIAQVGLATGIDPISSLGSSIDARFHDMDEKDKKAAKDRIAHMTDEQKVARLIASVNGTGEITQDKLADAKILRGEILTNKEFAEKYKEEVGGDEQFKESLQGIFADLQHEADAGHLSIDKEAWNKARSKYLDIHVAANGDKAKGFIASEDFDIKKLRKEAVTDPATAFALASVGTGEKKNGRYQTKFDLLTDKQKEQVQDASSEIFGAFTGGMFAESTRGSGVNEAGQNIDDLMRAFSRMEGNATSLSDKAAAAISARLNSIETDTQPNGLRSKFQEGELAAIRKNLVASKLVKLDATYKGGKVHDAAFDLKDNRKNFKALAGDDLTILSGLSDNAFDDADKDTAKTTFDALSKESIDKLKDMVGSGARAKGDATDALAKINILLDSMEKKARRNVSQADLDSLSFRIKSTAANVRNAASSASRDRFQAVLDSLQAERKAKVDQMDNDALAKIKTLRAARDAAERYI